MKLSSMSPKCWKMLIGSTAGLATLFLTGVRSEAIGQGGPYFGQTPPGAHAEMFAPGIVCTGMNERDVAITSDGSEIYFGVTFGRVATILMTRLEKRIWTEPAVAPFAAELKDFFFEPCLSADGKRMLFLTNRPTADEKSRAGWAIQNIGAVDRDESGCWKEPYDLGAPINTTDLEFFPSLTRDNTLYFTRGKAQGKMSIVRARCVDGKYQEPEPLPDQVNGKGTPYNAFIARDESYLIACVDGRTDSVTPGRPNYYIFFRDCNDRWSEGINMGERVNFPGASAASPYVTPDGKYFFFSSTKDREISSSRANPATFQMLRERYASPENGNTDIYWIDAAFIESLRPSKNR